MAAEPATRGELAVVLAEAVSAAGDAAWEATEDLHACEGRHRQGNGADFLLWETLEKLGTG